ncbi:MAG: Centrin-3 [Monoraphidium minutum]|nr:MAG: Centrin-3 [Monoraphidium minutum]
MRLQPRARPPPRTLSEGEEGEVAYAFDRLAEGQGGEVTPRQLKIALRALGFPVKKADVRALLRDAGLDASAPLGFDAFREACAAKLLERAPREEVARAFQLFDLSGAGRVGPADLRVDITPDELQDMVAEFDADGDGYIDAAEFAAIMAALDE